ncbi:MAG: abortive infection family protein [Lautropia sp.]
MSRLLAVFEDIVLEVPESHEDGKQRLIRLVERDGFEYRNGRIVDPASNDSLDLAIPSTLDTSHLSVYLDRINSSVESDPELAVGTTKELVEATLKTIRRGLSEGFDESKEDIPVLLKRVKKALDLAPDDVDSARRGADTIKRILSNLGAVAIGVAELRNLYGSGHGRSQRRVVDARLARLVVGSGGTLCRFLLETYEDRQKRKASSGAT